MWHALLWKEWHHRWRLWVMLAAAGAVLVTPFCLLERSRDDWMVGPVLGLLALLFLTADTFPPERQANTDRLLNRLAAPPARVWLMKVSVTLTVGALLLALLTVFAMLMSAGMQYLLGRGIDLRMNGTVVDEWRGGSGSGGTTGAACRMCRRRTMWKRF